MSRKTPETTEQRNPRTRGIDEKSTIDILRTIHREDATVVKAIAGVAAFGEALASQHGRLLDTNEGARLQVHNWSLTWTRLI